MTKELKIKSLVLITLLGFIISCIYHYYLGAYLGNSYPLNSFLFKPSDSFTDFRSLYETPNSSSYFPFANLIIYLFCHIKPYTVSFLVFITISFGSIFYYFIKNTSELSKIDSITSSLAFSLFSFPVLFLISRANYESFVFIFLCLFIHFYKKKENIFAIIFLSFSIAMKLYPAIFLILLFSDRKYKEIIYTILLVIIFTIVPSWILYGGIHEYVKLFTMNVNGYQQLYVIQNWGLDFGHSLFNCIKEIFSISAESFLHTYLIVVVIIAIITTIYVTFTNIKLWEKATILVFIMDLLPYVSSDYKLIHIFIPLFLFGLLLIPKNYRFFKNLYDGVFFDPIIMLLILTLIIYSNFSNRK